MEIRLAVNTDLNDILDIYNHEVKGDVATLDLQKKSLFEWKMWFQESANKGYSLYVAEVNGKVVGYAYFSAYRNKDSFSSTVEIDVYVDTGYRNQGIATALAEKLLQDGINNPKLHMVVSVINSNNPVSTHMEEKFGFTHAGTVPEVAHKFGEYRGIEYYYRKLD